jgi:hypothetical protein
MHRRNWATLAALSIALGCAPKESRDDTMGGGIGGSGGAGDDGGGDGEDGDGGGDGGDGGDDGGDGDDGDIKFDIAGGGDVPGGPGDPDGEAGCEKVDFLFVIDNSGSMEDEQANLITSFPGFISTIQETLDAQDFHIMAIDTDAAAAGGASMTCSPAPQCCDSFCQTNPGGTCNGDPCTPPNDACDPVLGAGKNDDQGGNPCDIQGGNRYFLDGQPDLTGTFDCAARVGINGDGNEVAMQAMSEAIAPLNQAGQCNEGFVRDDAILVITIITDEEDDPNDADTGAGPDENSPGNPQSWMQTVVDVKLGDEKAAVVLSLVGDTDLPNAICEPLMGDGTVGAEPAPRLRDFAELFTYGQWCSVCAPDFTPCFEEAVSIIDTACDEYVPPG